ncbi:MAG: VCBS repeat-containing protein [Blastocatellia bacterium]|nr:VCBS repeat-containing protein [Blastocatellia bacterium]
MYWTNAKVSTRKVILSMTALCLAVLGLITGAQLNSTNASSAVTSGSIAASPAATFPGTGTGAIPDGLGGTPPAYGPPLVVSFPVSGVSGNVTNVSVSITLTHTFVGDVDVVLAAPGGAPSMVVVSRIGVITATGFGDSSNYGGTYVFADSASGTNIWTVAGGVCGDACVVLPGTYRTTAPGQAGQTNPAPVTSLNATFAGLTPAQANGTWTLTFRDAASVDVGNVSAANLTIEPTGPVGVSDAPVDLNGDSRTDYVVVRNVGGGPSGQVRWFYNLSSGGPTVAFDWGLAGDFFISEDFDNDNKDDIAVWRPGAATVAAFYIHNSATNTARVEAFGQTGDDPTIVDDYNNDGSADLAVYRAGVSAGQQSTWFYRTVAGGPVTYVPWGINGDFPAPGDYDGDGSADFVVQRDQAGAGVFYTRLATGAQFVTRFGLGSDPIVPGDYDADGKTDIAVVRGINGQIHWFYEPSGTPGITSVQTVWGSPGDFLTPGDYDGDGRNDFAIWRSATGTFWVYSLPSGTITNLTLGVSGDYPVANFNVH